MKPAPHKIQGIGAGFIPKILNLEVIDDVMHVTNEDAFAWARRAAKEEGIKDTLDKISADITDAGGKVETVQKMDRKNYARVADKKHTAGFYANVIFTSAPAAIAWVPVAVGSA